MTKSTPAWRASMARTSASRRAFQPRLTTTPPRSMWRRHSYRRSSSSSYRRRSMARDSRSSTDSSPTIRIERTWSLRRRSMSPNQARMGQAWILQRLLVENFSNFRIRIGANNAANSIYSEELEDSLRFVSRVLQTIMLEEGEREPRPRTSTDNEDDEVFPPAEDPKESKKIDETVELTDSSSRNNAAASSSVLVPRDTIEPGPPVQRMTREVGNEERRLEQSKDEEEEFNGENTNMQVDSSEDKCDQCRK